MIQIKALGLGLTQVELSGSLDVSGASRIEPHLREAVAQEKPILVDLSEVTFVSSQGIRVLVAAAKGLFARGSRMALVNPRADVRKVLQIMSIDKIIPIFDDYESATGALLGK